MIILLTVLLILFILSSAFFSASEVSLFSLSSVKLKSFETEKDARKQLIAKMLDSPQDLLVTVLMFNILINILVQNVASGIFGDFARWEFTIGVPLALTLIFGDVLPKSVGLAYNVQIAYRIAPILLSLQRIVYPLRKVLIAVTSVVSRILFFFLKPEKEISFDELEHALKTSRHEGVLNEDEAELIRGYLLLKQTLVKDLTRPREEVLFYNEDEPLSKLIHLFVDQQCSRLPICKQGLDQVLGMMSASSFFVHRDQIEKASDLLPLLSKPFFAPEGMDAEVLLMKMYDKQESLALVVDEYGSISGLIALEDLVEKVIGEIADARDGDRRFTRSSEDVIIASGKMEIADFEEVFGVSLTSENHRVTIGGWLIEQVGDIPQTGAKYTFQGFFFHVLAADVKRVRRLYIRQLSCLNHKGDLS